MLTSKSGKDVPQDRTLLLLGGFIGIAWMCQFQVIVFGYITFKRFSGLYFWSICSATVAVIIYTIGAVLFHFVLGNTLTWIPTALITVGYLTFIPSEFLIIYSRLHLFHPGPLTTRFVKVLLLSEYIFVEIPVTTICLVAINTPINARLETAVDVLVGIGVILLAVVYMTVSGLYVYLAWKTFGANGSQQMRSILGRLYSGTAFLFLLDGINIGIWFMKKALVRGCWQPLLFSCTLLVEFWILTQLTQLASSTLQNLHRFSIVVDEGCNQQQDDQSGRSPQDEGQLSVEEEIGKAG